MECADEDNKHTRQVVMDSNRSREASETQPTGYSNLAFLDEDHPIPSKVYPQRWYVVILAGIQIGMCSGIVWNTFGPISDSASLVFGWTNGDIALLSNLGVLSFLIATPLFAWLLDVKGLRIATIMSAVACAVGSGLRTITSTNPAATWLMNTGQVVNGFGLPMVIAAPAVFSATWFPAHQRTTSTSICVTLIVFSLCASFIIGPVVVRQKFNVTSADYGFKESYILGENDSAVDDGISDVRGDIMKLMYIEFGMAAFVLLLVLVYFPAKPPTPPTASASLGRVNMKLAVTQLLRNFTFWKLSVVFALSQGVYFGWLAVFHVNVKEVGVTEGEAGLAGFLSVFSGAVTSLFLGKFVDIVGKRMKLFILLLYVLVTAMLFVFSLMMQGYIPFSNALMYVCLSVVGSAFYSVLSPFYELTCEVTYPIAEGITNSVLSVGCNITSLLFLFIPMIPNIGTLWMNWTLTACFVVCIPILMTVKEQYNRMDVDTNANTPEEHQMTRF